MTDMLFPIGDGKLDKMIEQLDGTLARRVMSLIFDGSNVASIDRTLLALVAMDEIHSQIHRGRLFTVGHIFEGVADNGNADILVVASPLKHLHMRHSCDVGGDAYIQTFAGVTTSADGTALTAPNSNQTSAVVAAAVATHTPTVTGTGTALPQRFVPAGSAGRASGGSGLGFGETVFPAGGKHLIRVTNKSGQARTIGINLYFYEVDI